jgi:hypothetical protein
VHSDLSIPVKFTVPSDNHHWPTDCWGIRLGEFAKGFRNGDYGITESQKCSLLSIGFVFDRTVIENKQHVIERDVTHTSAHTSTDNSVDNSTDITSSDSATIVEGGGDKVKLTNSCDSTVANTDVRIVEEESVDEVNASEINTEAQAETEIQSEKDVAMIMDLNKITAGCKVPCLAT